MKFLDPSHEEMFSQGIHRAEWHRHETDYQGFPDAYFFHPTELRELFESYGVKTLEMATCEGAFKEDLHYEGGHEWNYLN